MSIHQRTCVLVSVIATAAIGLMAGCAATPTPRLDDSFGQAVRAARQAQTRQPSPPETGDAAQGLDGKSASHLIERYQDSFKTPPKTFEIFSPGTSSAP
jgi:hypothetical protein